VRSMYKHIGKHPECFFEESATIACIIEYGVRPAMEGTLGEAFAVLVSEIQAIDGFISMDDFRSQTRPQRGEF
jgi:heme-degrading monooxygenase HmoA